MYRCPGPIATNTKPNQAEDNVEVYQGDTTGPGLHPLCLIPDFPIETESEGTEKKERVEDDDIDPGYEQPDRQPAVGAVEDVRQPHQDHQDTKHHHGNTCKEHNETSSGETEARVLFFKVSESSRYLSGDICLMFFSGTNRGFLLHFCHFFTKTNPQVLTRVRQLWLTCPARQARLLGNILEHMERQIKHARSWPDLARIRSKLAGFSQMCFVKLLSYPKD